jgi:drug/metabolite transporter (DMT)-like permease
MPFEIGILFAFGAMLSWGVGDFLIQRTTRKIGDLETLTWIGIIGAVGLLPFVWKEIHLIFSPGNLLLLCGLGVINFVDAMLNFEALKQGKISVVEAILELELPVTVALSFIFLKESLGALQVILIIFILCGIILIATRSFGHLRAKVERGAILALATAVLMGGVNFLTGFSSKTVTPLLAIWVPWVIIAVAGFIWINFREGENGFFRNASALWSLVLWTGVIDTAAWVFYAFATRSGEISVVTAITESYPAIAICLGVWLNRERIVWHQWFGAGLALACSVLLAVTV